MISLSHWATDSHRFLFTGAFERSGLGDSIWEKFTAIRTIGAVIVALFVAFLPLLLEWRRRPKLKVEFKNSEPFCRHTGGIVQSNNTVLKLNSYWLRLMVKNYGKTVAKRCKVKLLAITDEKIQRIRDDFDPTVLRWVENVREGHGIDIDKHDYEFVNLLSVDQENNIIKIQASDLTPRGINLNLPLGNYYIVVSVYCENANPRKEVYGFINENDKFDKVKLLPASESNREKIFKLIYSYGT